MNDIPKIVFFHGFCGSGTLFFKLFPRLAANCCLIVVDLAGMGGSQRVRDYDRHGFTLE